MFAEPLKLKRALKATVTSGNSSTIALGADIRYIRIQRATTSAGTLQFVLEDGTVTEADERYELTEDDADSGWIATHDRSVTIRADSDDVDYVIWRLYAS